MQNDVSVLPVRGSDAIEILTNDHQIIKRLLVELTQPQAATARKDVLEQLKSVLTIHNATEETLIYPALYVLAHKKSESQHLYHETGEADVLLFELDTMLKGGKDSDFAARAEKLRNAIEEHIEDEEGTAFPHLQDAATVEQARTLTNSVREFRGAFRFDAVGMRGRAETGEIGRQLDYGPK